MNEDRPEPPAEPDAGHAPLAAGSHPASGFPPASLGTSTCIALAAAGFVIDLVVAGIAWTLGHAVLGIAIAGLAGGILPVVILLRVQGVAVRSILGSRPGPGDLWSTVWIVGSALPPVYALAGLVARVFPPPESQLELYRAMIPSGWTDVAGGGIALVVVAPLAEEILFRGLLLRGFAGLMSAPIAIVCGGLLFGASHGSMALLLPLSGLGVLLGAIVWRTRGITATWLGHGLFNLVGYADVCITHDPRGTRFEAWCSAPWVWIPASAVLVWGIVRLRRGLPAEAGPAAPYLRD